MRGVEELVRGVEEQVRGVEELVGGVEELVGGVVGGTARLLEMICTTDEDEEQSRVYIQAVMGGRRRTLLQRSQETFSKSLFITWL